MESEGTAVATQQTQSQVPVDAPSDKLGESIRCLAFESTTGDKLKARLTSVLEFFLKDQRYRNDERYLKLWMRYADLTDDADKVFLMLKKEGIGTKLALFWAAWAFVLEMTGSFNEAAETITEGISRGAEPASLLEDSRRVFYGRMLERMRKSRSCTQTHSSVAEDKVSVGAAPHGSGAAKPCDSIPSHVPIQRPARRKGHGSKPSKKEKADCTNTEVADGNGTIGYTPGERNMNFGRVPFTVQDSNYCHRDHHTGPRKMSSDNKLSSSSNHSEKTTTATTLITNPFSPSKRRRLTTDTVGYLRWASSCSMVHDFRINSLPKRWPRKMVNANTDSRRPVAMASKLGNGKIVVKGVLGEGALAMVFSCKVSEDQDDVAVKVEREDKAPSLPWECYITLQLSERLLLHRHRAADSDVQASLLVVEPQGLFMYRDGCAMIMPQGSSGTLHDLVALYAKRGQQIPQLVAMHYTVEMLRFCRAMHSALILHVDIKPDNWLLTRRLEGQTRRAGDGVQPRNMGHTLSLIDFGRAIDLSIFPHHGSQMAFMGQRCATSFSCPAMLEGRPWKYDVDLFALGSCVFFMLHGKYLEVSCVQDASSTFNRSRCLWRPVNRCKRYWEVGLWDSLFHDLLNTDHDVSGTSSTHATLKRLEDMFTSYLDGHQRSRDLQECLRRQDNMLFNP